MPSAADLKNFRRIQNSAGVDDTQKLVSNMPSFPDEMKRRFPSLAKHEEDLKDWNKKLIIALRGGPIIPTP